MQKTYSKYRLEYRSENSPEDYEFEFCETSEGWRAYIRRPNDDDYKRYSSSRATDAETSHRLTDSENGKKYICWDSPVRSLEAMRRITKDWSEGTAKFIHTGETFGGTVS
ncbi:MAG: hypothetical protein HQL69_20005 [Magnetococcales bacterium]|nr:hypothetical protein [Magnetococcales bacterium]